MAFYGWICLVVLPFLLYNWLIERRDAALDRKVEAMFPYHTKKGGGR